MYKEFVARNSFERRLLHQQNMKMRLIVCWDLSNFH